MPVPQRPWFMSPQCRLLRRLSLHREVHPAQHTRSRRLSLLIAILSLRGNSPRAIGTRLRAGLPYRAMAASWSIKRLGPEPVTRTEKSARQDKMPRRCLQAVTSELVAGRRDTRRPRVVMARPTATSSPYIFHLAPPFEAGLFCEAACVRSCPPRRILLSEASER
jgi:hypothetical protein